MAQGDKNLPVKLVVVEATKIEGEHVEVGTVLNNTPTDIAFELGGSGKVRAWTKELEADMKARAKAEKAAAEERAAQSAAFVPGQIVSAAPGISAEQIAETIKAAIEQGIQAGIALAAAAIPAEPAPEGTPGAQG